MEHLRRLRRMGSKSKILLQKFQFKSLGVAPVDLNGDGLMDLIVANDTVQGFCSSIR